jgi:hypothetical protein
MVILTVRNPTTVNARVRDFGHAVHSAKKHSPVARHGQVL